MMASLDAERRLRGAEHSGALEMSGLKRLAILQSESQEPVEGNMSDPDRCGFIRQ